MVIVGIKGQQILEKLNYLVIFSLVATHFIFAGV
ncbi:hypothetical protein KT99_01539 [Shewanella benthica KT99]|uniref:Uncharacterized protein n=1 Tax=Shewanella benthica KT99 TaxID=314608 RepID=A9DFU3_9GAMM|nr:hypothetical protein KT99_01539 [Shewanella benthica KT99]